MLFFFLMLQQVILDVASRIAPCCNRSSNEKFLIGHSSDGAWWGWDVEGNGRAGDGGTAGNGDVTRHGGAAGTGHTWGRARF